MTGPRHREPRKPRPPDLSARELNRAAREAASSKGRRKITLAILVAITLVVSSIIISYIQLRPQEEAPPDVVVAADVGASALVVVDRDNVPAAILFVAASSDQASRLVAVPSSLFAIAPGFGEQTLAQAYQIGGVDLLALSITNLLGARIDGTLVLAASQVAAAFDEPLEIDLLRPFIVEDASGGQRVVAGEGPQPRTPEMAVRLLTERGTDNDLDFLFRQGEVWESIFLSVASRQTVAQALLNGALPAASEAVNGAAQDPDLAISALPVVRVNTLSSGEERYSFDVADAAVYVEQSLGYLRIGEDPRLVVEILNGNGGVGVTQPVAEALVLEGYRVLKTDNAATLDYPTTQIIAQGRDRRESAIAAQALLGYGQVVLEVRQPSGVFDLTIIIGQDSP